MPGWLRGDPVPVQHGLAHEVQLAVVFGFGVLNLLRSFLPKQVWDSRLMPGWLRGESRVLVPVFALHGSIGFRPNWSTHRDDAGETPDEELVDDSYQPESRC
jgi:hypothetical protein